jgi:hypothetical protein
MVSDSVCSGTRQKIPATTGGTIATQATAIHHGTDLTLSVTAATQIAIAQMTKINVLVFLVHMLRV